MLDASGKIPTKGKKDAEFLVVARPPSSEHQSETRSIFTSAAGQFLVDQFADIGYTPDDFVFHNSTSCYFFRETYPARQVRDIDASCRQRLVSVIDKQKPKVIITLGAAATAQVFGRAVKITKVQGIPTYNEEFDCVVIPMLDPVNVGMYPQNRAIFESDMRTFKRVVDYDYDLERASQDVLGDDYRVVTDLQFMIDKKPKLISYDLETLGLDWARRGRKIISIQLCTEDNEAYIIPWDHPQRYLSERGKRKISKQLKQLLCAPGVEVIGHNLKYDLMWTWQVMGFRFRIGHDTLMMLAILNENLQTKNLDTAIKLYVPAMAGYADAFNSEFDKSRMDLVPWDRLVDYGCGDVDAVIRLYRALRPLIERDGKLWNHYQRVSIPGINAFASMERSGFLVDEAALDVFEQVMDEYVAELERSMLDRIPASIKKLHVKKGLKFSRTDFVRDVLFKHPDGFCLTPKVFTKKTQKMPPERQVASTSSKDHLPYFFEECPFTVDLAEWAKANRLLNTSVRRFRENYIIDGRIYPNYSLWTAVTGRSSSSNPNGQNIPKRGTYAKQYRRLFVPPEGCVLLEADLSQAELRIAACMANDHTMIRIYANNGDIHAVTAASTMGITLEEFYALDEAAQDLARFKAKAVNFGFIYGMGWRKFIVYAKTQYGVEFTEREATSIRRRFFSTYKRLPNWHSRMRNFAQEHMFVRSYSGRIRHLPMIDSEEEGIQAEAQRQAINSPVQEFASSLGVMAMGQIDQEVNPEYFQLCGFVHDALYAYVPLEYVEWAGKTLKHYMESVPLKEWFDLDMPVPIKADVGFGFNAGDTLSMKGLEVDQPYDMSQFDIDLPEQIVPPNNGRLVA